MGDVLHSLVSECCHVPQGVSVEDVLRVLRSRFGTSGIAEKAARKPKVSGQEAGV